MKLFLKYKFFAALFNSITSKEILSIFFSLQLSIKLCSRVIAIPFLRKFGDTNKECISQ